MTESHEVRDLRIVSRHGDSPEEAAAQAVAVAVLTQQLAESASVGVAAEGKRDDNWASGERRLRQPMDSIRNPW